MSGQSDPCMDQLAQAGCVEVPETIYTTDPILSTFCADAKVRLTIGKLICNGVVVSMRITSRGVESPASGPPCSIDLSESSDWENYKIQMKAAMDRAASNAIASLGLNSVLVATGSSCKADVSFDMPPFESTYQTEGPFGQTGSQTVLNPGGRFFMTIPCQSEVCCYGYANVVNNQVVGVTPATNMGIPSCDIPLSINDVKNEFVRFSQVSGGFENFMNNIVIGDCEEKYDLSRLIGGSQAVYVKSTKPSAGQALDYNVKIESIKESSLTFKSDIAPSTYQIMDITGKVLDSKAIQSNQVDIKALSKGVYFFRAFYTNGWSSVVKFSKD